MNEINMPGLKEKIYLKIIVKYYQSNRPNLFDVPM